MGQNWRNSPEWRHAKEKALNRDNHTCQICGAKDPLAVHHINDASYHKDQRYVLSNLITLCHDCHMNFHCQYKKSYRQKCTTYDWENFNCLVDYFKSKFDCKEDKGEEQ